MFLLDLHSANWELLWFAVDTILNTPTWDKLLGSGICSCQDHSKSPSPLRLGRLRKGAWGQWHGIWRCSQRDPARAGPQQDPAGASKAHPLGSFRPAGKNSPVYIVYICVLLLFHIVSERTSGNWQISHGIFKQHNCWGSEGARFVFINCCGHCFAEWVFQDIGTCTLLCALLFNLNMTNLPAHLTFPRCNWHPSSILIYLTRMIWGKLATDHQAWKPCTSQGHYELQWGPQSCFVWLHVQQGRAANSSVALVLGVAPGGVYGSHHTGARTEQAAIAVETAVLRLVSAYLEGRRERVGPWLLWEFRTTCGDSS